MTIMTGQTNAPRGESNGASQDPTEGHPQSTGGWCLCARSGDMWACQDRPRFDSDAEGRCCALGGVTRLAGTDRWDGYTARVLKDTPCEVTRAQR